MIFPGMDPYLEDPAQWPDVHARLIVYIAEYLKPLLHPRYVASIEKRVFIEGPDPESAARGWGEYSYLVCVNRATEMRDRFQLYPRRLSERLPIIRVPLAEGDADVLLDVQSTLERTYDMAAYGEQIDYRSPCVPPLSVPEQEWADGLIRAAKLSSN